MLTTSCVAMASLEFPLIMNIYEWMSDLFFHNFIHNLSNKSVQILKIQYIPRNPIYFFALLYYIF